MKYRYATTFATAPALISGMARKNNDEIISHLMQSSYFLFIYHSQSLGLSFAEHNRPLTGVLFTPSRLSWKDLGVHRSFLLTTPSLDS